MSNNKGFTLVEMIIVLAIIGIIIAMTYPSLSRTADMANENDRAKQEYVVNKALIEYYALTGTYPSSTDNNWALASDLKSQTGVILNPEKYQYNYTVNGNVVSLHVYMITKDSLW